MSHFAPAILALRPNGAETVPANTGVAHGLQHAAGNTSLVRILVCACRLTSSMWLVMRQLLKAHDIAHELNRPKWEFAVELEALEKTGGDRNDLRALICEGLVEHALETTPVRSRRRRFRRISTLRLTPASCFVLSDWGLAISSHGSGSKAANDATLTPPTVPPCSLQPVWDPLRRELRLGQFVLKRFRQPAKTQEAILAAFQEDGWPVRIDSPIPGGNDANAHDRLRDCVRRLNEQTEGLLCFESDGTGEGVLWRLLPRRAHGAALDQHCAPESSYTPIR
jgi:hypothetical protein